MGQLDAEGAVMEFLKEEVRQRREEEGASLVQVASALGVSRPSIQRIVDDKPLGATARRRMASRIHLEDPGSLTGKACEWAMRQGFDLSEEALGIARGHQIKSDLREVRFVRRLKPLPEDEDLGLAEHLQDMRRVHQATQEQLISMVRRAKGPIKPRSPQEWRALSLKIQATQWSIVDNDREFHSFAAVAEPEPSGPPPPPAAHASEDPEETS